MNRLTKWLQKDQEEAVTRSSRRALMMSAAALQIQTLEDEDSQWGGSSEGRTYKARDRELMDLRLKAQYFTDPCRDACGRLSLSTEQKLTCAMRMLAYGITADFCDDYLDIAKSTAIEILEHFTTAIWNVYHETYLRRPTPADLIRMISQLDPRKQRYMTDQ
ncbi:uncharacterized protein LOC112194080 [Rosa chinensis]|uniref:uncharacterized protein LOC112194080 n=1 Tax=Rosa chinensis TaxID=74649 RepID=UPI001AD8C713|nr:uncharacterized protein LOC112194080 [Rosa chinensis]